MKMRLRSFVVSCNCGGTKDPFVKAWGQGRERTEQEVEGCDVDKATNCSMLVTVSELPVIHGLYGDLTGPTLV
ncbi:uncharacterized protein G2W53_023324 [Senna tora]|uniref:Uncharacterized protein n=1 Tax=Senna tora TaxID=362788 RepID=A0A834T9Q0_9FABA|nr:uncharacterized protein G2W53_023324 [Senna tora]